MANLIIEFFQNNGIENQYAIATIIFGLSFITLRLIRILVIRNIRKFAGNTKNDWDDLLVETVNDIGFLFYLALPLYFALLVLDLQDSTDRFLNAAALATIVFYLVKALQVIIKKGIHTILKKNAEEEGEEVDTTIQSILVISAKFITWTIALLLILQNWGVNVTALVGGLGIAGIAIAFAFQSILSDLFSFFTIYFDKPFKVGDFVILSDSDMGTVEKIGLKSTRIRSLSGQELVVSNTNILDARINNYRQIPYRRNQFTIGVKYGTPREKLEKIPEWIKNIVENTEKCRLERIHLSGLADWSVNFELAYYVDTIDYVEYMDAQQSIILGVIKKFKEEGVEFPFPTYSIEKV